MGRVAKNERAAVRVFRAAFRAWPFLHGRGWILRAARAVVRDEPVAIDIGGVFIEGTLDDWMVLWTFMAEHERDAPFQRSLALLRPGDVAFDVGGNLGIWSLLAAVRGSRVVAFEPVPEMVQRFRAHVQLNGRDDIVLNPFALGAEEGLLPFFADARGNSGASSFVRRSDSDIEISVPVKTLDAYIDEHRVERVDLLKIDVEGAELQVFRGAQRLLSSDRAPMIFFEASAEHAARFGDSIRGVKDFLAGCGYRIFRWDGRTWTDVTADEPRRHEDLFAMKPQHEPRRTEVRR